VTVPICGEPIGYTAAKLQLSASSLAARIADAVNGPGQRVRSLSAVPSFIPIDFKDETTNGGLSEVDVVKKLIGRIPAHAEIFGGGNSKPGGAGARQPWIRRVSMILTSVGLNGMPFGQGSGDYLQAAGLTSSQVRGLATADISGVLLTRPAGELTVADAALLRRIEAHWTGVSMRDLIQCAARARSRRKQQRADVGVVVVAVGKEKAAVVLDCMRRGIASHLVIDTDLEDRLIRLAATEDNG
jgi:hypothetical protein